MSSDDDYVNEASDDDVQVTSAYGTRSARGPPQGGAVAPQGTIAPSRPGQHSTNNATSSAGDKKSKKPGQHARAAWEDVQRSWDTVVEGADGNLGAAGVGGAWQLEADARRRLLRDTTPLQRGIIRHLVLVLDASFAMAEKDMLPHRHNRAAALACEFVRQYFEQNPISLLAVVGMRDGIAVRVSDMGGNPEAHVARLREWQRGEPSGNPSLQNALEMCRGALFHAPSHGTREVLVIYGALFSSDPGDIHATLASLVADRVRVSIVGLSAHLAICAELCARTNAGDASTYRVALDEVHLRDLLLAATTPPVSRCVEHSIPSLLMMGFPSRTISVGSGAKGGAAASVTVSAAAPPPPPPAAAVPGKCACHNTPVREAYPCTRCGARVCKLPATCPACGLTLILSTHLARSYHHLFPLRNWVDVSWAEARRATAAAGSAADACFSCLAPFPALPSPSARSRKNTITPAPAHAHAHAANGTAASSRSQEPSAAAAILARTTVKGISESARYACVVCGNHFCIDCDVFAHEVLHNCPGCQSRPPVVEEAAVVAVKTEEGVENGDAMLLD